MPPHQPLQQHRMPPREDTGSYNRGPPGPPRERHLFGERGPAVNGGQHSCLHIAPASLVAARDPWVADVACGTAVAFGTYSLTMALGVLCVAPLTFIAPCP